MSRRTALSFIGKLGALVAFFPLLSQLQGSDDNEFVVIDGWILRADDLTRPR